MPRDIAPMSMLGRLRVAGSMSRRRRPSGWLWVVLKTRRRLTARDVVDVSSRPRRSPATAGAQRQAPADHPPAGPDQIAGRVGVPASTGRRILVRGLIRLDPIDRPSGLVAAVRRRRRPLHRA